MPWYDYVAYFFSGAFAANGIPHFVSGVQGKPFQTPFAKPPGKGLSTAKVNALWGFINFSIAYVLISRVGNFNFFEPCNMALVGLGALLTAAGLASLFGKLHGGNTIR